MHKHAQKPVSMTYCVTKPMSSSLPNTTLALAEALISRASVTPNDEGCQALISDILVPLGFQAESLRFEDVDNLWIKHTPNPEAKQPVLVFAGHTDVVPVGDESRWTSPPFEPSIRDGMLYGRGAADMKSSIAAMTQAAYEFVSQHPQHKGTLALLITSDEEGPSINGTVKVCDTLRERQEPLDYCVVGEPSSTSKLGDTIKNGRRGSLGAVLTVQGKQGHVAYPHLARNPIHLMAPALAELVAQEWDQGNDYFPPTTMQISNLNSGTGASNVVPGQARMMFNFRFSTETTPEQLKQRVHEIFDKYDLDYSIEWTLSGEPFLTTPANLSEAAIAAIQETCQITPELSTTGGTSDGRFIAKICPQVIELGPINASIHQVDEHIRVADIEPLKNIYLAIMKKLLT